MKSEAPLNRVPDLSESVVSIIAEVTRYPRNILTPEALLEDELGIESVKRAEILTVLSSRMSFEVPKEGNPLAIRTVGDVVSAVERLIARGEPAAKAPVRALAEPPPPPRAPEPVREPARPEPRREPVETPAWRPSGRDALPLAGKLALITGSGHGFGRDVAQHLFEQGASLILNSFHTPEDGDRAAAELRAQAGGDASRSVTHLWGSVANSEHLDALFREIESRHGHLDFVVHAAANAPLSPVAQIQSEDWERAFRTEVVGLHQLALRAARLMQPRGGGRIVAITHASATRVLPGFACAGTVKAAVESLVRYLAIDLAPKGILVNALSAGPFAKDIEGHPDREVLLEHWRRRAPSGRLPDARSVAAAVALLLAPEAGMMSGTTLVVDGGLSLGI